MDKGKHTQGNKIHQAKVRQPLCQMLPVLLAHTSSPGFNWWNGRGDWGTLFWAAEHSGPEVLRTPLQSIFLEGFL